ncbi:hypothetical protein 8014-B2_00102 [Lactobacillus phage ATCC 8014-B2]|uniref:Uncharacterized protein n=1 Tax=Lactobacillus phage ATCC 8014-B2 TaxID=1225795 RepID=K4IDA9_9CAUD|nr:hypothetical protein HOQ89_gp044 [Lactobacillus phage ATCC 8014-B2]AFU63169.1 hypothetical protein 8014-B2_00102 [Lactobacillus phage ATCC 8014-B2]
MRTKEFATKLNYYKYRVGQNPSLGELYVVGEVDGVQDINLVEISDNKIGVVKFNEPISKNVVDIVMKYAYTPVEERDEENKYLVHLKGINNGCGYLNYRGGDRGRYFVSDYVSGAGYKTYFTKKEINKLVENPDFFLQKGSYTLEDC